MLIENFRFKSAALCVSLIALASVSWLGQAAAAPMRYAPKVDSKIAYKVEIVAELPERIHTHKGNILYEVTSVGELIKLKYSGDLASTSERKDKDESRLGPGHFFHHLGMGPSVSSNMNMRNRISLTSQGKMNSIDGNSQLPYLLGNLSLFVFEPLPEKEQKSWTSKNDVAIVERYRSGWWGFPFPRSSYLFSDRRTAACESADFELENKKGDFSTFRKKYKLHAAEDKESLTVTGNGKWVFNHRLNLPEAFDCKYKLTFKDGNITLDLPVVVKYNRLSGEEYDKYEKEKKEKREKSKAEHEKRLALRKAPLTGDERRRILKELKSSNQHTLFKLLIELKQMEPRDDKDIAKAIKPLLKHSSDMVRDLAAEALGKFAPELGQKFKLNKDYAGSHPLDVTGQQVTDRTPLPTGLIVAVNEHGHWYKAAKVVRKQKNGQVDVEMVGFGRIKTVHWAKIRLAPPEVDQPFISKRMRAKLGLDSTSDDDDVDDVANAGDDSFDEDEEQEDSEPVGKSERGYRPWTDNTGTFAIVAKYAGFEGEKVKLLRKKDGKEIKVPLARLSKEDRKVAERLKAAPKPGNPFE